LELFKEVTPILEKIFSKPENKDCNFVITGHSLGGGMTTLLAMLFLIHPPRGIENNIRSRLKAYGFGGAKVLSREFLPLFEGIIFNVVNQYDVVPRLDHGSIKDMVKVITSFHEIEKHEKGFVKRLTAHEFTKDLNNMSHKEKESLKCYLDLYDVFKSTEMTNFKLAPMGRTFVTEKCKEREDLVNSDSAKLDQGYKFTEILDPDYFDELILSKNLVKHHFPHLYEEGLFASNVSYFRE